MSYTTAQLIAAYTAANDGASPDEMTSRLLEAFAEHTQSGQLSDSAALAYVINSAEPENRYEFFTGRRPTDRLVMVSTPTDRVGTMSAVVMALDAGVKAASFAMRMEDGTIVIDEAGLLGPEEIAAFMRYGPTYTALPMAAPPDLHHDYMVRPVERPEERGRDWDFRDYQRPNKRKRWRKTRATGLRRR